MATRGVKEYRATIDQVVTPTDVVLELGCEWGSTTRIIADRCREIIGTDMSPDCIERARSLHPEIHFEVLDAFDLRGALSLQRPFNKIYIDLSGLSGYRALLDAISLAHSYASVFRPQAVVLKSGAVKHFSSHCLAWRGRYWGESNGPRERLRQH